MGILGLKGFSKLMFLPLPAAVFIPVKPCFVIGLSATLICAFKAISKTDVKNVFVFT